jgi:hypothetical protein
MQLPALNPAEIAFLTAPAVVPDELPAQLTRKLAAVLSARLRLPVRLNALEQQVVAAAAAVPLWQPDNALATLWLTRRLGGRHVAGQAGCVSPSLLRTLDATLAECWLDRPQTSVPVGLAWQLASEATRATLSLRLPPHPSDMTRWAREVIRHV